MPGINVNTGEPAAPADPNGFNHVDQTWEEYAAANGGQSPENYKNWQAAVVAARTQAYSEWSAKQTPAAPKEGLYNPDGSSKNGAVGAQRRNADGGISPQTWEDRLAAGEFEGNEAFATQLEVRRRRQLLTDNHGMKDLPPDVADLIMRDSSGKVRKARASSTQSALGATFDVKSPLFGER